MSLPLLLLLATRLHCGAEIDSAVKVVLVEA
jgi:hypothetical protein